MLIACLRSGWARGLSCSVAATRGVQHALEPLAVTGGLRMLARDVVETCQEARVRSTRSFGQRVMAPKAVLARIHQSRRAQRREMLADQRLRELQRVDEVADADLPF